MLSLAVQARTNKDSEELVAKGMVPAVFYGPKEASTAIAVAGKELERIWKQVGETGLITLTGIGDGKDTLIHDIQFHPVTSQIIHADFYVLEKGKKVTLRIPLEFVGTAPAEKNGFIVVKTMHEIEIEVAPQEIPRHLTVDISKLEGEHDRVLAKDIALPASATLKAHADDIVAAVTTIKEEKIEAPVVEAAPAAPVATGPVGAATPPAEKK